MYSRDEFEKAYGHLHGGGKEVVQDQQLLRAAIIGAVAAENVVKDEYWNKLLGYVAAEREKAEEVIERYTDAILHPSNVSHEALMAMKVYLADVTGALRTLTWIEELPRLLMEAGGKARELFNPDEDAKNLPN